MKNKVTIYIQNLLKKIWTERSFRLSIDIFRNLIKTLAIIFVLLCMFGAGIGAGYFASLVRNEPLKTKSELATDIYQYEEATELYLAGNDYLGTLRTDLYRQHVSIDNISPHILDAIVATEDEHFYEHNGVVPKAVFRAIFQEAANTSMQSGGSTLTQQLIKNQMLTNDVSFDRKAKEILLAMRVEKLFSKDEILEAYLNVVPFGRNSSGQNIAGIQSAAKGVFGKNAKDVSIPQAAFLAGLPQSPFGYTPFTQEGKSKDNLEPGLNRMKIVLKSMLRAGKITEKEYNNAIKYDITKDFIKPVPAPTEKYPYLTDEIERRSLDILVEILAKKDGYELKDLEQNNTLKKDYYTIANRDLRQNGYKIYTTVDRKIYDAMQKVKDNYYFGPKKYSKLAKKELPIEVGAMLIDNNTGGILSFVGGRDHKQQQVNHATQTPRQNGSTMKPLLVYAPAIEEGLLQPGMLVADVPTTFHIPGQKAYSPNNFDFQFHGLLPARAALAESYNLPVLRMYYNMQKLGLEPMQYLEQMGFNDLSPTDYGPLSTSLGGLTTGVTVEDNVNAYTTFANGGQFVDAYMVERIVDKNGKEIYKHKVEKKKIFSPETAYLTIDMMRDTTQYGTGASLHRRMNYSSDWAAKSGTTNDQKDVWFMATNPSVTFGTWLGYDQPMYLPYGTALKNMIVWTEFMNAAYKAAPNKVGANKTFKKPSGVEYRSFCTPTGGAPTAACAKAGLVKTDLFNKNFRASTNNVLFEEKSYVTIKNKAYAVFPSTPKEFVQSGFTLGTGGYSFTLGLKGYQESSTVPQILGEKVLTLEKPENISDGRKPSSVANIQYKNNVLTWSANKERDIIGYYIYRFDRGSQVPKKVRTVRATEGLRLKLSGNENVTYSVTAVDITGSESQLIIPKFPDAQKPPEQKPPTTGGNKPTNPPPTGGTNPTTPPTNNGGNNPSTPPNNNGGQDGTQSSTTDGNNNTSD
ncbi:MAG: transglycosylase domain-containing protein [Bacillaceae bacterium]